jgi:hypothetical protein
MASQGSQAAEKSMREILAQLKHERDFAQNGPSFARLRRAHPRGTDSELKEAIVAAVKFDDDCFEPRRPWQWIACFAGQESISTAC